MAEETPYPSSLPDFGRFPWDDLYPRLLLAALGRLSPAIWRGERQGAGSRRPHRSRRGPNSGGEVPGRRAPVEPEQVCFREPLGRGVGGSATGPPVPKIERPRGRMARRSSCCGIPSPRPRTRSCGSPSAIGCSSTSVPGTPMRGKWRSSCWSRASGSGADEGDGPGAAQDGRHQEAPEEAGCRLRRSRWRGQPEGCGMTNNPNPDPPGKVLAMLNNDPPMPERYTPDLIERLPLDDITARLGELGVRPRDARPRPGTRRKRARAS